MWLRILPVLLLLHSVGMFMPHAMARPHPARSRPSVSPRPGIVLPYVTNRTTRVGNLRVTFTNWGVIGSQAGGLRDPCTNLPALSMEYPRGSANEYLYQAALWIGGIRGQDTLVSIGIDGWANVSELFAAPYPEGQFTERTSLERLAVPRHDLCDEITYSPEAKSEHDLLVSFTDTVTNPDIVQNEPWDGRPHRPLGLSIDQSVYAWSAGYAGNFVLIDYNIENIQQDDLHDMYVGIYADHDVGSVFDNPPDDDLAGYIDSLDLAWMADNDGDPVSSTAYAPRSARGVAAIRLLRSPNPQAKPGFNWWTSNSNASWDWGPRRRDEPFPLYFPAGNLGTPNGDLTKYQMMRNGGIDYDQLEAAIDHSVKGWLPPVSNPSLAADIAGGFDTRYLISTGPFDLSPGETVPLTIALMVGPDFHQDPAAFSSYFDPMQPDVFRSRLNFEPLARTAEWARRFYDTPGLDTDGNGTFGTFSIVHGDTNWIEGDGVPDFSGPPPPEPPPIRVSAQRGKIVVSWNGEHSELKRDLFSGVRDWEGYRVYLSRTGQVADYAMLAQRDRIDYQSYQWDAVNRQWDVLDHPMTVDSLRSLFSNLGPSLGFPFHPDSFPVADVNRALRQIVADPEVPQIVDTSYFYFKPHAGNLAVDDLELLRIDSAGLSIAGVIYKPFPEADPRQVQLREDGTEYRPFYEYRYVLDGIYTAEPIFVSVTAFDFGDPVSGLGPQETAVWSNATSVHPGNLLASEGGVRPKPGLYPNPYRRADGYRENGWEPDARLEPDPERARRITFYNLPDTCTIRIWSLDGDLVRVLRHAEPTGSAESSFHVWNVITRNGQKVSTGLYIWAVGSRFGTDVGKLAVIR